MILRSFGNGLKIVGRTLEVWFGGKAIATTTPTNGQALVFNSGSDQWQPGSAGISDPYSGTLRLSYSGVAALPANSALGVGWTDHAIVLRNGANSAWLDVFRLSGANEMVFGSTDGTSSGGTIVACPYNASGTNTTGGFRVNGFDRIRVLDGGTAVIGHINSPPSRLDGGLRKQVHVIADADTTVDDTHNILAYTGLTTTRTVTLPTAAALQKGRVITVKDADGSASGANKINVVVSGGATIEGATPRAIAAAYGTLRLLCTGTAWVQI